MDNSELFHNIPDELYVGVKGGQPDTANFPPAYAVENKPGTKAFTDQSNRVNQWCGFKKFDYQNHCDVLEPKFKPSVHSNVPTEGFKVKRVNTRWRTSNKVFEIIDPRGWTLEISADNLVYLIQNTQLDNGVFIGKHVWGRANGSWVLLSESSASYKQKTKPAISRKKLQPGDIFLHHKRRVLMLGEVYFWSIKSEYRFDQINRKYLYDDHGNKIFNHNFYEFSEPKLLVKKPDTELYTFINKPSKPIILEENVTLQYPTDWFFAFEEYYQSGSDRLPVYKVFKSIPERDLAALPAKDDRSIASIREKAASDYLKNVKE